MRTINTLAELRAERQRLKVHKVFLEAEIKKDVQDIKKQFAPLTLITKGLSSKDNSAFGSGVGAITDLLLKNVVLKNSGFLTKMIVPFIAKNAASNFAEEHKTEVFSWIEGLISKFRKKREEKREQKMEKMADPFVPAVDPNLPLEGRL
jgi:hypothetical protein